MDIIKADLERRSQAKELAQSAGGVERWFAGMSSQDRERWADLKESLLKAEREEHELWRRISGSHPLPESVIQAARRKADQGPVELDNGIIL
jgi:hypothetical protein